MLIYKYSKAMYAIQTIDNGAIKLSHPEELNDPFDCSVPFPDDDGNLLHLFLNYISYKEYSRVIFKPILSFPPWQWITIFHARFWINIYKKMFWHRRQYFEMPFFGLIGRKAIKLRKKNHPEIEDEISKEYQETAASMEKKVTKLEKTLLIGSFGIRWDSILMWSHYADSHKGVCFEFDVSNEDRFQKVIYTRKRTPFDIQSVTKTYLAFDYCCKKVDVSDPVLIQSVLHPFLKKYVDWQYEREVRCLASENESKEGVFLQNDYWYLAMPPIKRIILGCRISSDDEKSIRAAAKKKKIPVCKAVSSQDAFKVIL